MDVTFDSKGKVAQTIRIPNAPLAGEAVVAEGVSADLAFPDVFNLDGGIDSARPTGG
jgi:hypothetical protein